MVSNASDDLPLPLKPVITTSLSRGISSVRFLRLCSRAPPILIKSFAMVRKFHGQTIHQNSKNKAESKGLIAEKFSTIRVTELRDLWVTPYCGARHAA